MIHGFDLNDPLVCEGIIGDGCGGGRIFYVKDNILNVYDPQTKENITLFHNIENALELKKSGCILFIECKNGVFEFDISLMKMTEFKT